MTRMATLTLCAILIAYAAYAFGQARIATVQSVMPIGSSSSNGISFVWFYDQAERGVYVCRASGTTDTVDCRPKATLP